MKADFTLWAWGYNGNGELGNNSKVNSSVPVQIGVDKDWYAFAAGGNHALAQKTDGTLWAWGHNAYGQLGDGTWNNKLSPVQIAGHAGWQSFSAGAYHTLATKNDGTLWVWGFNGDGELGDTVGPTNVLTPVKLDYRGTVVINNGAAYTNNRSVMLTLNVVDKNGVTQMQFSNDGTVWTTPESYIPTRSWNLDIGDGTKTVYVRVMDQAGNWSNVFNRTITLDTTIPAISITSPLAGYTNNAQPLFTSAGDGSIVVYVDGLIVNKVSGENLDWLEDGPHTIRVEAADLAGNSAFAETAFTIDTTAPYVEITSPPAGPTRSRILQYSVSEGTVVVTLDGVPVSALSGTSLAISDGFHTVTVASTDQIGNSRTVWRSFTLDTVAPTVSISSPAAGLINTASPVLNYAVSDGQVTVKLDGVSITAPSGTILSGLSNATHTVRVESSDPAGNFSFAEKTFMIDSIAPSVAITSPKAMRTRDSVLLLNYTASDGVVTVKVDGEPVSKISGDMLTALPDGPHTVRVEALDAAGNTGYAVVNFTIDSLAAPAFLDNSVIASTNSINTALAESSTIFFYINGQATVTLKIVSSLTGSTVYQSTPQACVSAGAYFFTWDGKDNSGKIVSDEAYLYILEATDGFTTTSYNPPAPAGTGTVSCSPSIGFDPEKNLPMTVTFTPAQPSRVDINIYWGAARYKVLDAYPATTGDHTFVWDGRSPGNRLLDSTVYSSCSISTLLPENIIITTGDTVKVTDLRTDPYEMHIAYGQFSRITYTLSHEANVTVKLTSPSGTFITLLSNEPQAAGQHILDPWNGLDAADITGKKTLIREEGDYMVSVKAVSQETGAPSTTRANIRIGY